MNLIYHHIITILQETKTMTGIKALGNLVQILLKESQLSISEYQNLQFKLNKKLVELFKEETEKDKTNN